MKKPLALTILAVLLFGCISQPRTTGAAGDNPVEFGNATNTTVWVGGTAGIVNATGQLIGRNLTLTNTTCSSGQALTSNSSGVFCATVSGTGGGNLTGTGAATYLAYWTNATNLANTSIFYNTTTNRLGFNITSPTAPIEVQRYNTSNNCAIQVDSPGTFCARQTNVAYPGLYATLQCADRASPLITVNAIFKGGLWVSSVGTARQSYNIIQRDLTAIQDQGQATCTFPNFDESEAGMIYADDSVYCQYMNFELPWDYKPNGLLIMTLNWLSKDAHSIDVRWHYDFRCLKRCAGETKWELDEILDPTCVDAQPTYLETSYSHVPLNDASADCRDMAAGDKVQIRLWRDNSDPSTETAYGLIMSLIYEQKDIGDANVAGRT